MRSGPPALFHGLGVVLLVGDAVRVAGTVAVRRVGMPLLPLGRYGVVVGQASAALGVIAGGGVIARQAAPDVRVSGGAGPGVPRFPVAVLAPRERLRRRTLHGAVTRRRLQR